MDDEYNVDVVVVGGGISGLCAARHLTMKDPSTRVIVLEAKDRLGGRTLTQNVKASNGTDDAWDLGGQWVGTTQTHIMSLLNDLHLDVHRQYTTGTKFMRFGSNKISTYSSNIPTLPLTALIDLQLFMTRIDRMRKQVPVDDPFSCEHAEEWDSMSLQTFKLKTIWTKACHEAVDIAMGTVFGVECSQMSLLFLLMYMNAAGGLDAVLEAAENCGQEFKIKGGSQQISHLLADKIGKENIWLSQPVSSLSQDDAGVTVTTSTGRTIHCNRAILAMPPCQLAQLKYSPCLPPEKSLLHGRMSIGYIIKFLITYEKAFWREAGLSGEIATNSQWSSSSHGCHRRCPISVVYDATSSKGNPALVGFIAGSEYMQWSTVSQEERKTAVLNAIAEFFGPEALDCVEYIDKDWRLEEYNEGGPVSVVQPGAMMYFNKGIRQPFNRLHFAGTETATVWCGFMNGAVQAGQRAANEVLYHLRPQVVSAEELAETAYAPKKMSKQRKGRRKSRILKLVVVIGICTVTVLAVKRGYLEIPFFKRAMANQITNEKSP